MPPPNWSGLSLEELRQMEDAERRGVEARLQCLRNIHTFIDASVLLMQQYLASAAVAAAASATTANAASRSADSHATQSPESSSTSNIPTTSKRWIFIISLLLEIVNSLSPLVVKKKSSHNFHIYSFWFFFTFFSSFLYKNKLMILIFVVLSLCNPLFLKNYDSYFVLVNYRNVDIIFSRLFAWERFVFYDLACQFNGTTYLSIISFD